MTIQLQSGLGLGLYPTDPCYQVNRPSWLPYWRDTNGEYACAIRGRGFPLEPPPPPRAPQTEQEMLSWTPDDVFQGQQDDWEAWKARNRELAQPQGPMPPPDVLSGWWESNRWFVLAAGLGLVAIAWRRG